MIDANRLKLLEHAYAEQAELDQQCSGARGHLVGYKIAALDSSVQRTLGVAEPIYGPVRTNQVHDSGADIHTAWQSPLLELELGLRLLNDTSPRLVAAVPSFEIIDSPVPSDGIEFIRGGAGFGAAVVGFTPIPLPHTTSARLEARLFRGNTLVHSAPFATDLGGPHDALAWLDRALKARSCPLRVGMFVLSGGAGGPIPLEPNEHYRGVVMDRGRPVGAVSMRWTPPQTG